MGTLTLAELQDEFLRNTGNRSDLTQARQTRILNLAQERLARLNDFEEMQVTTTTNWAFTGVPATDMFLPLPDSSPFIRKIHSVLLKDGLETRKLRRILPRLWDKTIGDATALSTKQHPVWYTIWDFSLAKAEAYPLPHKAFDVQWRITQWPTPLVDAGDKSRFRMKDELLIELATIYLFDQLGKEDESVKHQKKFATLFKEALTTDSEDPDVEVPSGLEQVGSSVMNPWDANYHLDPFAKRMP